MYSICKALYLATWFYYIPFLALTVNFSMPFLASFAGEYVDDSVAGEMSAEQIALIEAAAAGRVRDPDNNYVEPSIPEVIAMMEAIPLITDEWKQDPEILVSPMSLEDFWSCFWADDAPYYVEAITRDPDDKLKFITAWGPPTPGFEEGFGKPVIEERRLEKKVRTRGMGPDYAYLKAYTSLVEKTDTRILIKQTQKTEDAPYVDTFEVQIAWEFLTPDPLSYQVAIRKSYYIRWFSSPMVKGIITKAVTNGVKEFNTKLSDFFLEAAVKYAQGPPYAPLTETPMEEWENESPPAARL